MFPFFNNPPGACNPHNACAATRIGPRNPPMPCHAASLIAVHHCTVALPGLGRVDPHANLPLRGLVQLCFEPINCFKIISSCRCQAASFSSFSSALLVLKQWQGLGAGCSNLALHSSFFSLRFKCVNGTECNAMMCGICSGLGLLRTTQLRAANDS